jgi:lincosamide nucleotidyltransferase A/C/D/E
MAKDRNSIGLPRQAQLALAVIHYERIRRHTRWPPPDDEVKNAGVITTADMSAAEVHTVLDALAAAGCRAWISGGWGVDALIGHQTRDHRDLDLAIPEDREAAALLALARLGYQIETDWRPVRVEVAASRGRVDLHPLTFDDAGDGHQAGLDGLSFRYPKDCFTTGAITGRQVACLSVDQQLHFHSGYELRDIDRADLALLHQLATANRRQHQ